MNLSLYLLLAPSTDTEQSPGVGQPRRKARQKNWPKAGQDFVPVYNPPQSNRAGCGRLVQASRNPVFVAGRRGTTIQSIGMGMSVVANACGFLVITAAALMLLRVAEISLL